jgi:hypothetical protein
MKFLRVLVPVLVIGGLAACELPAPVPNAATGREYTPAVDATGATDVSDQMAAFLAGVPNGSTIELVRNGRYRIEKTFSISRRQNLTVHGNGATIFATTPGDRYRANVRVVNSNGITITGLKVSGGNPGAGSRSLGYDATKEGQHGFDIASSSNVSLLDSSATDTWSDWVHVGQGVASNNVLIQRFTGIRSGRQGVSVGSANNFVLESSYFNDAKRSTFDLEPGSQSISTINHVVIRNNTVHGGRLNFVAAHGHGPVNDVTIQGNRVSAAGIGITVNDLDGGIRTNWKVLNNTSTFPVGNPSAAAILFMRVNGVVVQGNVQPMQLNRSMYMVNASSSCNVNVSGNTVTNGIGQVRYIGTC